MAHKVLIGGTGYEVTAGRCLVSGTGYALKKGRTCINGTTYELPLKGAEPDTYTISYSLGSGEESGSIYVDGMQIAYGNSGTTVIAAGQTLRLGWYASTKKTVRVIEDGTTLYEASQASGTSFAYEYTPDADCSIVMSVASSWPYAMTWTITTA